MNIQNTTRNALSLINKGHMSLLKTSESVYDDYYNRGNHVLVHCLDTSQRLHPLGSTSLKLQQA